LELEKEVSSKAEFKPTFMITFKTITLRWCIFALPRSIRSLWALFAIVCFFSENGHCQPWVSRPSGTASNLNSVAYGNNTFVAVGDAVTILSSPNGMTWTKRVNGGGPKGFTGVAYGNNRFIALGEGNIATSADGVTWTTSALQQPLVTISYGAGTFVALDVFGDVATSPDGSVWTGQNTGSKGLLVGLVYANNQFVAVGLPGVVLTSPDGVKWAAQNSGRSDELFSVTYGNNQYVAVGEFGIIITSPNGTNWTLRGSEVSDTLNGITYGNNEFIAVGVDEFTTKRPGSILSSPDGVTWTTVNAPANQELSGVTYGGNQFVAVGLQGTILQSGTPTIQPPTLGPVSPLPSGAIKVRLTGVAGQTYSIEASSNLKDWLNLTNVTLTTGAGSFTDPSAPKSQQRFYRGVAN
jgi:hypothetical protein